MRARTVRTRLSVSLACLVGLTLLLCAGPVWAKRPTPPEPPPPAEGGTIYLSGNGTGYQIESDGTGFAPAPVKGIPSTALHDGKRWFLQLQAVDGTYPSGQQRKELFALASTGAVVQLTDDPTLQLNTEGLDGQVGLAALPMWATDESTGAADGKVSFLACRWGGAQTIVEEGLYVLYVDPTAEDFDVSTPLHIDVGSRWLDEDDPEDYLGVLRVDYAWSPDGASLVFSNEWGDDPYPGLWRLEASESWDVAAAVQISSQYVDWWSRPYVNWRPGTSEIYFKSDYSGDAVYVVDADEAVPQSPVAIPLPEPYYWSDRICWSPSGDTMVWLHRETIQRKKDIVPVTTSYQLMRANPDGSGAVEIGNWRYDPPDFTLGRVLGWCSD